MGEPLAVLVIAVSSAAVVAGAVFYFVGKASERRAARRGARTAEEQASRILAEAEREAESEKARALLDGREEAMRVREELEKEQLKRREELDQLDRRLQERESLMDRKMDALDERESRVKDKEDGVEERERAVRALQEKVDGLLSEARTRLERAAGMSGEEAKQHLLKQIEEEARAAAAARVRDIQVEAKKSADREAKKIVALAIQRVASEFAVESSVSTVALPNDEMKGRIIGREGRNIRAFETETGVDVIIDDTPDAVVVSCFDPVRREVARLALEQLVADGRIHPGRIEEVVAKIREQVAQDIAEAGEQAVYELGIHDMDPELVRHVGMMKYRTSYGQNILSHSIEVARIAASMASELRLDARLAKRGALLHDIGKVLTHQHEGTHVELGVELATKYGEEPTVINCIAAHHDDVAHESPLSVIVQAADAVSGARPGARGEAVETYVKRLAQLEEIASRHEGIEKSYAIQAGREVRIVVTPDSIDDEQASALADEIAKEIEKEVQYPGQIKVVVIRETRSVGFAR